MRVVEEQGDSVRNRGGFAIQGDSPAPARGSIKAGEPVGERPGGGTVSMNEIEQVTGDLNPNPEEAVH